MIKAESVVENGSLMAVKVQGCPARNGKVRRIIELPTSLLIVATDRISAYDVVMPNGIPDKGRVLTQLSLFWFELLRDITPNHLLPVEELPDEFRGKDLAGRFMLCKRARVIPIECIVRGYLAGSGWKEYQKSGTVCGIALPAGLRQCSRLPGPIFTPSTKAEQGLHDENITFVQSCQIAGHETMTRLRTLSLALYSRAHDFAATRGIILADTKFEWGFDEDGNLMLIDEVLTPDSSRFWPADVYKPGQDQPSFDKQFVRDWLDGIGFNRQAPGPMLPPEVVAATRAKYIEAYTRLTEQAFLWA